MKHIVVLTKSWTNKFGRKYPIGQKITCDNELHKYLTENGYADEFGKKVSKVKVKSDFFKNKKNKVE